MLDTTPAQIEAGKRWAEKRVREIAQQAGLTLSNVGWGYPNNGDLHIAITLHKLQGSTVTVWFRVDEYELCSFMKDQDVADNFTREVRLKLNIGP